MVHTLILLQTQPVNIIQAIFDGVADSPSSVILAVSLVVFFLASRAMLNELRESRKMLNTAQLSLNDWRKSGDEQESKALDMATKAIEKWDRVAEALDNFADAQRMSADKYADAQRMSADKYFESAEKIASAHIETTNMLVNRIAAMEDKRAEDEIYANESLLRQINDQLVHSQEVIGSVVGSILDEARALHEATRSAVASNNEVLMAALKSTPPAAVDLPEPSEPQAVAHESR